MFASHIPGVRNHVDFFGGKISWHDNENGDVSAEIEIGNVVRGASSNDLFIVTSMRMYFNEISSDDLSKTEDPLMNTGRSRINLLTC